MNTTTAASRTEARQIARQHEGAKYEKTDGGWIVTWPVADTDLDSNEDSQPEAEPKPLTRKQCVDALAEAGYTGPTSYTMAVLREVVAWVQAGSPKDGVVPAGAITAMHPEEKPAKAKKPDAFTAKLRAYLADFDTDVTVGELRARLLAEAEGVA